MSDILAVSDYRKPTAILGDVSGGLYGDCLDIKLKSGSLAMSDQQGVMNTVWFGLVSRIKDLVMAC